MKQIITLLACASLFLLLGGCNNLPKDMYLRDGEITINTPWGPSTVKGGVLATGKPAIEAAKDVEVGTTIPQTAAEKFAAKKVNSK